MKTFNLSKDTLEGLYKIDSWLRDSNVDNNIVLRTREIIDKIIRKGYYSDTERELLNELRIQYLKSQK